MIDNFLQELFGPDIGGGMFSGKPGGPDSGRLMDLLKGLGGGGGQQVAGMMNPRPNMPQQPYDAYYSDQRAIDESTVPTNERFGFDGGVSPGTKVENNVVVPNESGDKNIVHPEDTYSWKDELNYLPQQIRSPTMGGDGGGMDLSARSNNPLMPPGGIPLPQPRPAEAPQGGAPAPMLPDQAMAMLRGPGGVQASEGMPQPAAGNMLGINPAVMKRLQSSLAGGMAGGDPRFKGGAFMKGMGGAMSGGLKSDKEDSDASILKGNTDFKNKIALRDIGQKEKRTDALSALYGARTKATVDGKPSSAWNKPAHERLKDAERLIIDKGKQLYNGINPLMPKDQRDAAKKAADAELGDFKKRIYKQYGFDQNGSEIPGGGGTKPLTPATPKVMGDKEAEDAGLYEKPGKMMGTGSNDDPYQPKSQEDFDALKPGAVFLNPADGRTLRKGGQKQSAADDMGDEATA